MIEEKVYKFGIKMPESLHAKLKIIAKNDQRSLHGFILKTLSDVVKESEQQS